MNKAEFVPAIGEQLVHCWAKGLKFNGYDLKFWSDESFFKHNIALQSCYYGINGVTKNKKIKYRKSIKYDNDLTLISDSGGFQIASFKKKGEVCNIEAIDSLRWQEENADICMNLDVPPTLGGVPTYEDFIKALDTSVENFALFAKERKNYNMKLYNVLHGENLKLMEVWYDKVKDFPFDGWAVGIKPPFDPMLQALGFMFLFEKGEVQKDSCYGVHFFGTSGKNVVPTLVYIANMLKQKKKITYDSSSYNIGSIYRTYYSPFEIGPSLSFGEKFKTENPDITSLPCRCPVCKNIKVEDLNRTDIYAGSLISLHNLYQYIDYNNTLNSLVKDKEKFLNYLDAINISEKTKKSIEFIDFALEKGVYLAAKKFEEWLVPNNIDKNKQVSIFHC